MASTIVKAGRKILNSLSYCLTEEKASWGLCTTLIPTPQPLQHPTPGSVAAHAPAGLLTVVHGRLEGQSQPSAGLDCLDPGVLIHPSWRSSPSQAPDLWPMPVQLRR